MPNIVKKFMVKEYEDQFSEVDSCIFVDYQEIQTDELNGFRQNLDSKGMDMMVLRNSMAQRAFEELGQDHLNQLVSGPTAIVYSSDSVGPVSIAKEVVDFQGEDAGLDIHGGAIGDRVLEPSEVEALSELPGKKDLLAQFAQAISAPVKNLASGMEDGLSRLARGLKELSEEDSE